MIRKLLVVLFFASILVACQTSTAPEEDISQEDLDSVATGVLQISDEAMGDIVQSFSNPVEMAALMKDAGVKYSEKYLTPTDYADNYNTNFKKALGLGVLSADLGYLNIYNKTATTVSYLTVIKRLSDALKIGQFFDFSTLKRFATNNENLDSLLLLSVSSFNEMDAYLRETNRSNLSMLIVTGVWVEGLYLATQVVKNDYQKEIADRIGEQKIILNDMILILQNYQQDPSFARLLENLNDLKQSFQKVEITVEYGEPESVERDGMLMIIQNTKSVVHLSRETLNELILKTEKFRNTITQQ